MAQITREMTRSILEAFAREERFPLTIWEEAQLAHAWNEREDMRAALSAQSESIKELVEALRSFVYEFGDKTNSATVNKARIALAKHTQESGQ